MRACLNGAGLELVQHLFGVLGGEAAQQHAGGDGRLAGQGVGVQQVLAQQRHQLAPQLLHAGSCSQGRAGEGRVGQVWEAGQAGLQGRQ